MIEIRWKWSELHHFSRCSPSVSDHKVSSFHYEFTIRVFLITSSKNQVFFKKKNELNSHESIKNDWNRLKIQSTAPLLDHKSQQSPLFIMNLPSIFHLWKLLKSNSLFKILKNVFKKVEKKNWVQRCLFH